MDDECIIEEYSRVQGLSPDEVLMQKERMQAIITIYREIAKVLTAEELEILVRWIIEGRSYADIGRTIRPKVKTEVNISISKQAKDNSAKHANMTGKRKIQKIIRKIKAIVESSILIDCKDLILDNPSMEEMNTPGFHFGWLCSRLQKINNGGYWGKDHNKRTYKSKSICLIPEYLQKSFGNDHTKCTLCGIKCTRKSKFKD